MATNTLVVVSKTIDKIVYEIAGGKLWAVDAARYVEADPEGAEVIHLRTAEGDDSEGYLIRTLEFYGYDLRELTDKSAKALKDALDALDATYLNPRVLVGLSQGDEYAAAQWQTHEEQAGPLREKLAALAGA